MRIVKRYKAGALVASIVVAGSAGVGIWQAALGGWGFHSAAVSVSAACVSSCSGSDTLTATVPPSTTSVTFSVDGFTIGTDSSSAGGWSIAWDTSGQDDGDHSVIATASDSAGSADSTAVTVNTSNVAPATANLWVATTGSSSCTRNASAVDYAAAVTAGNVCDTPPNAYKVASLGDTVYMKGGTYTTGWTFAAANAKAVTDGTCNYNYGGSPTYTGCVTFQPATGETVTLNASTGVSNAQIWVCSAGIRIKNVSITERDSVDGFGDTVSTAALQVGKSDNSCRTSGNVYPHDIVIDGVTFGGQASVGGSAYNVAFVNGTAASTKELGWYVGGNATMNPSGIGPSPTNIEIVGITFKGYQFQNLDSVNHHMECIHVDGGNSGDTLAGNQFQGCPTYAIRMEAEGSGGGVVSNMLVENNYFDGQRVNWDCHNAGCLMQNNTFRFNSIGSSSLEVTNDAGAGAGSISGNVSYGNVGGICTHVAGWSETYNVYTSADTNSCGASSNNTYSATVTYTSEGSPNYNLDLSGAQTATNYVPNTKTWPATNIHGATRSGTTTDAGAY